MGPWDNGSIWYLATVSIQTQSKDLSKHYYFWTRRRTYATVFVLRTRGILEYLEVRALLILCGANPVRFYNFIHILTKLWMKTTSVVARVTTVPRRGHAHLRSSSWYDKKYLTIKRHRIAIMALYICWNAGVISHEDKILVYISCDFTCSYDI